ncbi:MAG TPA: hypothetical protein VMU77_05825 [Acidimicrobiales bacterium]|nr:hypothetical protein [Acidimicrobiales bacterium]
MKPDVEVAEWKGAKVRYDLFKEFTIAFVCVALLSLLLAAVLSSPDKTPVTLRSWAQADPVDFASTAITELDGTSALANYGPPYNNTAGAGQKIGPVSLQRIPGVTHPIDTASDFVVNPLKKITDNPVLSNAIIQYQSASSNELAGWEKNYETAIAKASFTGGSLVIPNGNYGPVSTMISNLLSMARSGGLDGALLASPQFYGTDYTKPLLFLADGSYMADLAKKDHLQGPQWGMMNETGSYPGQAWLWLYTMWYQVSPFSSSGNADALIWGMMMIFTLALILVPFIPGLRSIPRLTKVYRLIWRRHYSEMNSR